MEEPRWPFGGQAGVPFHNGVVHKRKNLPPKAAEPWKSRGGHLEGKLECLSITVTGLHPPSQCDLAAWRHHPWATRTRNRSATRLPEVPHPRASNRSATRP